MLCNVSNNQGVSFYNKPAVAVESSKAMARRIETERIMKLKEDRSEAYKGDRLVPFKELGEVASLDVMTLESREW